MERRHAAEVMNAAALGRSSRKARTVRASTIGKVCHKARAAAPPACLDVQVGAAADDTSAQTVRSGTFWVSKRSSTTVAGKGRTGLEVEMDNC
jgi:hypothetical protein